MSRFPAFLLAIALSLLVVLAPPASRVLAKEGGECVRVQTEVRNLGYGFSHIVHLENGCETAMRCTVKTDVNPEPTQVKLARDERRSVVTFFDSPSREFKAFVSCEKE